MQEWQCSKRGLHFAGIYLVFKERGRIRRSSLVARPSLVEARRAEDKGSPYY